MTLKAETLVMELCDGEALLDLAQIIGAIDATDDEKVIQLVDRLIATDLIPGEDLGVRGLLAIEDARGLKSGDFDYLSGPDTEGRLY